MARRGGPRQNGAGLVAELDRPGFERIGEQGFGYGPRAQSAAGGKEDDHRNTLRVMPSFYRV